MYLNIIILVIGSCSGFIWFDGYNIIKEKLKKTNENVLIKLLRNKNINKVSLFVKSFSFFYKIIKISISQRMYNNISKIDKNRYVIEYVIGGILYKKIVIPNRGPCPVLYIINEKDEDITDDILSYSDNNYEFQNLTPCFFGSKKLTFYLSNGDEKIFNVDEILMC